MNQYLPPVRKFRWATTFFIPLVTLGGLIGAPVYAWHHGITAGEWALFLFFFLATGLSITVGYHRYFSHKTFQAHPVVKFLLLFFGAATFQRSALRWASQHRQHHQFTDTELDPHDSRRGFWYSHMGWIMFYKHHINQANVPDLVRDKMVMHQHRHYNVWAFSAGVFLPLFLGWMMGELLGAFVLAVVLRTALVLHSAFFINSFAHMVGSRDYDPGASARDHWLGALITNGEGYHSFHHRFPNDYRNGCRWWHWDPSKWTIWVLARLNLVQNLKRTPAWQIREAGAGELVPA